MKSYNYSTGSVPIFITLIVITMITSGAIIMSGILSRQIRFAEDVTTSERAFYAANSGIEEALYIAEQKRLSGDYSPIENLEGNISYGSEGDASYVVNAQIAADALRFVVCIDSEGDFRGEKRRIHFGPPLNNCTIE